MRAFATVLLLLSLGPTTQAGERYLLSIDGLACPFCSYGIEKQLLRIDGVEQVETRIDAGQVVVTMRDGAVIDEPRAREAVDAAGFTLQAFSQARPVE